MRKVFSLLFIMLISVANVYSANELTVDDVVNNPFRAKRISTITPLPDGESYACLEKNRIVSYSFKTGKQTGVLFDVENTIGQHIKSIDGFQLCPDGSKILVYTNSKKIYRRSFTADYYIYNVLSKRLDCLSENGPQQSPIWSNDGNLVAFVRDNNIFLVKLLYDNSESQVTKDGKRNSIINGVPDWVNEEEFSMSSSMCFTADGSQICWIRYDESDVPTYPLQMYKGLNPEMENNKVYPNDYSYKYPKAGQKNSVVSAWSYDIQSHRAQKLQLPITEDDYICNLLPTEDPSKILFLTLNRRQNCLNICAVNPRSTLSQILITEKNSKYVIENTYSDIILSNGTLLLLSDRDGYRHIYQYSLSGSLLKSVTPSNIDVVEVYGVDSQNGDIYYQAAPTPLTRKIYVSHKNGKIDCLTPKDGTNNSIFSSSMKYYIHSWSNSTTPTVYASCQNNGKQLSVLQDNKELNEKLSLYAITQKEFFTFLTSEGVELNGVMFRPSGFDSSKKYPVIMFQYSGPGSQEVLDSWSLGSMGEGSVFETYLCQLGFIVVFVDGRGTGCRGEEFEKCTYMKLGELESRDQVEAALWFAKQSYVDSDRIGIWGWSFGGFNTLMSMSDPRNPFVSGVAVAPPTDWRFYDTIYTERFMRLPSENPSGYDINPINRVSQMNGALLLCHGLADDNVHPQNMFEYTEALVQSDKNFSELLYTNRNHSIYGGNTRRHLLRQISQHFISTLKSK